MANPAHVSDWKMGNGTFIELDLTQLTTLNDNITTIRAIMFHMSKHHRRQHQRRRHH